MKLEELLLEEIHMRERLNPEQLLEVKLVSAKTALKHGVSVEAVAEVLKLRIAQVEKLKGELKD